MAAGDYRPIEGQAAPGLESGHVQDKTQAAQALTAIIQNQHLRYGVIILWALGLMSIVGIGQGLGWMILTMAAGTLRGWVEKRVAARVGESYGLIFPTVAAVTTMAWALAPAMAWFSGHTYGPMVGVALLMSGYLLVFVQLRTSPKQAMVISSPYTLVGLLMAASLWGSDGFLPFVASMPFAAAGLFVLVAMSLMKEDRIMAFQNHQAHLIQELETARDRANAANEAKSSFLGVISHELRTPMNGVLGAAELLAATDLQPHQAEFVGIVRNSGNSLLALLNDILDMTKIEAGRMTFDNADVDVAELNERISGVASAQAAAKGLGFRTEFVGEVPAVVRGDAVRVGQILQNLLSNAVKFTDAGEVVFRVEAQRTADDRCVFRFTVADTGPGIAPEDMERLFQPFTQLDASSTRRFGGTGLGLTISRRMAEIMGGTISVTSEVGKGATFVFETPAHVVCWEAVNCDELEDAGAGDVGLSLKVLVVEDHPVNRMLLDAWMSNAGHVTIAAEHGEQALEMAAQQTFDLILMDVNMPVMDGLTATRHLRSQAGPNQHTPVVVLSASARAEDHEAGMAAGADAYLNKPIDFHALAETLARTPGGREALRQAA